MFRILGKTPWILQNLRFLGPSRTFNHRLLYPPTNFGAAELAPAAQSAITAYYRTAPLRRNRRSYTGGTEASCVLRGLVIHIAGAQQSVSFEHSENRHQ